MADDCSNCDEVWCKYRDEGHYSCELNRIKTFRHLKLEEYNQIKAIYERLKILDEKEDFYESLDYLSTLKALIDDYEESRILV